ncbi:hypothetical protein MVEG_05795 [Podila verticillata NRRL 6337]|nr:hypothetical protein MVEG_05795 [Podila verticillata NRRL 6337]
MVRHEKRGSVNITWGYDEVLQGYFLSVKDECLESQLEQSAEVGKIVKEVYESGSGYYFQLHTYAVGGFGYKVSQPTMFTFMRRRCKGVWYCSETCQIADWKVHKTNCVEF